MFLIAVLTCLLLESLARLNKSSCCSGIAVLFVYLGGLFSSVIIYRLFFNGLKRFPGSWWARISKFWHFYHVLDAKKCLLLEELRLSYGDIVRTGEWNVMSTWTTHLSDTGTGPNEITIYCPEALTPVHAYGLQCKKSAWYDMLTPFTAMNTTRSKTEHDKRRRAYESGLSVKAVQGYHNRVQRLAKDLSSAIEHSTGGTVNITTWMQYFAFDAMGELGFGKAFNQVKSGRSHFETEFLRHGMSMLAWVTPVPWLYHLALALPAIPGLTKNWLDLLAWSVEQVELRLRLPSRSDDIMSHIINDWSALDEKKRDMLHLGGDAIAVVIAGRSI
ncbi:MAG: hypothetical protein L6R39_000847 [Caloplaca ligustica]|nr:MAG: hypothetical protein L6R39_000847 [Caloplaca ligustica]